MRITEGSRIAFYAFLCTMILFNLYHETHAQAPEIEWVKGYGNPNGGHVHYGMQTSDGGYIAVGTSSIGEERYVGLIIKTDSLGNKEWLTNVGSDDKSDYGFVNQILETKDGNYIACGALCKNGEQDRALFFLDSKGNITAQHTYPGKGFDAIEGIDFTEDGGIIATGYLDGDEPGGFIIYGGKCFIMKTDAKGNLEWDKTLDPVFHGMRVLQTEDGGYAVCSNILRENSNDLDFCLLKTDKDGDLSPVDGASQDVPSHYVGSKGVLAGGWREFDRKVSVIGFRFGDK